MMELVKLSTPSGLILWARLSGQWSGSAFDRLAARIAGLALPAGSQVVLDFSAIDHLDYRAVPRLIRLAATALDRQEELRVVGFSPYLRRIVDFGGALDGREFLERHVPDDPPSPAGPAPQVRVQRSRSAARTAGTAGTRRAAVAAQAAPTTEPVDAWARSLASAVPARGGSRLRHLSLRRVTLRAFASLLDPSVN